MEVFIMEMRILEALEEMENKKFNTVEDAKKEYSENEIFDIWLRYEGIIGYTGQIINVLGIITGGKI
jgi:hypothetical protein